MKPEIITGAEIVIRSLQKESVDFVFGYPGGAVLNIYDAIFNQKHFKHVLVRHEQAAVHAADAFSRSSGKVGVALVTSGPGATNAVTGIATAYMDSVPMVIISGQVPTHAIGEDAFQECDTVGITRPCVKHNFLVKDVKKIASTMKKAFYLASSGRPGPVLVDIPKDITAEKTEFIYPDKINLRSYTPVSKGHNGQIKKALELLLNAKKPMIYSGGGVVLGDASDALKKIVNALGFPITNTLMGLGGFPASDAKFLGMLGMHGTYEANMAMQDCDVLFAVGARFDDRVIGNPDHFLSKPRKIIHVDIDPASISKRVKIDVPIVGDVKSVLEDMYVIYNELNGKHNKNNITSWMEQIKDWSKKDCMAYKDDESVIKPQRVIQTLHKVTKGDAFVTSDVGQHQMWAAQSLFIKENDRFLTSGGMGAMGFGLPTAIGAHFGDPLKKIVLICGDGGFQLNIQELETIKRNNIEITIILINNYAHGMVRQFQESYFNKNYQSTIKGYSSPNFQKVVNAYGIKSLRLNKNIDIESTILKSLKFQESLLIELIIKSDSNVYPKLSYGKKFGEMEPDSKPISM